MHIGQVARDMRENGTRYGFVSTYEETVILKISRQDDGRYALLCSPIIPHNQPVMEAYSGGPLSKVSVRCALAYLIYRASHNETSWSVKPSQIVGTWFGKRRIFRVGDLAGPNRTGFRPTWKTRAKRRNPARTTHQAFRELTIDTTPSMDPTPVGVSPDDPKDLTWNEPDEDSFDDDETFEDTYNETPSVQVAGNVASRIIDAGLGRLAEEEVDITQSTQRKTFGQVAKELHRAGAGGKSGCA